ncbi:hypothetical protein [Dyadobacter sp. CY356]|uniref:hypothetical protein n=1 Tax=Dyadobacter sp. CY356 TaxID=2906442 RepID=UPI001F3A351A|nr:hypothetical protein [Dyadobacter sp. CY356]MCF0056482.1 hypothetical protein [Dyadobacter sp. CY356]
MALRSTGEGAYTIGVSSKFGVGLADVEGVSGDDGAGLHFWSETNGNNQRFYFNSVSCGSTQANCDFNVSASSTNNNPSPGQSLQLTYGCSGNDCAGISYSWSGNGVSGNSSPLNITAPGSAGTYSYTVTASKSGCGNKTATTSITVGNVTGTCISLGDQCSGNSSEVRTYTTNMSSSGTFPLKLTYRAHEGPSVGLVRINGGSWQSFNLGQTSASQYVEITIGSFNLNSGNNTVEFASAGGYICFRQLCAGTETGSSCDFNVSVGNTNSNPIINQALQLNYNCAGVSCGGTSYLWSGNGVSGSSTPFNINAPGSSGTYTYTVTASKEGCANKTASTSITVGNISSGNTCINLGDQCSGNSSEIRSYTLNPPSSGNYQLRLTYKSHESASVGRIRINGGTWQTYNLTQTSVNQYVEVSIGNYYLSGSNTMELASNSGYFCFRQLCGESGSSGRFGVNDDIFFSSKNESALTKKIWLYHQTLTQGYLKYCFISKKIRRQLCQYLMLKVDPGLNCP